MCWPSFICIRSILSKKNNNKSQRPLPLEGKEREVVIPVKEKLGQIFQLNFKNQDRDPLEVAFKDTVEPIADHLTQFSYSFAMSCRPYKIVIDNETA